MTKLTDEEKAEAKAKKDAEKAAKAEIEAAKENGLETIKCTCKNVHIGGGVKLTATQNKHGNWVDGETAQVSHADAVLMEDNGQVQIL